MAYRSGSFTVTHLIEREKANVIVTEQASIKS